MITPLYSWLILVSEEKSVYLIGGINEEARFDKSFETYNLEN